MKQRALFHITQPPNNASSFVSCHPTSKQCQQLCFTSPSLQTMPAASFRFTQSPNDASSSVSCHPVPKQNKQLRFTSSGPKRRQQFQFASPSTQTKQAASFCITQTTPIASVLIHKSPDDVGSSTSHSLAPK